MSASRMIFPGLVAACALGSIVSTVVAIDSWRTGTLGDARRATISTSVFSGVLLLLTAVFWIPGVFFPKPRLVVPAFH